MLVPVAARGQVINTPASGINYNFVDGAGPLINSPTSDQGVRTPSGMNINAMGPQKLTDDEQVVEQHKLACISSMVGTSMTFDQVMDKCQALNHNALAPAAPLGVPDGQTSHDDARREVKEAELPHYSLPVSPNAPGQRLPECDVTANIAAMWSPACLQSADSRLYHLQAGDTSSGAAGAGYEVPPGPEQASSAPQAATKNVACHVSWPGGQYDETTSDLKTCIIGAKSRAANAHTLDISMTSVSGGDLGHLACRHARGGRLVCRAD